jgi:hypothetical protein
LSFLSKSTTPMLCNRKLANAEQLINSSFSVFVFPGEFQINNNGFYGALPEELFESLSLQYLYLHNNFFNGTLSENVGKLKLLEKLVLNNNALTGPLPAALGDLDRLCKFRCLFVIGVTSVEKPSATYCPLSLTRFFFLRPFSVHLYPAILWVHFNQFEGQMPGSVCTRRLNMEEPSSLYADCFGENAAVSCERTCCTHCCHNEIYYCYET